MENSELGRALVELRDKIHEAQNLLAEANQEFNETKTLFDIASADYLQARWKRALFDNVTREKFRKILDEVNKDFKEVFGIDMGRSVNV